MTPAGGSKSAPSLQDRGGALPRPAPGMPCNPWIPRFLQRPARHTWIAAFRRICIRNGTDGWSQSVLEVKAELASRLRGNDGV